MIRKLLVFSLILYSMSAFSQKGFVNGNIVTDSNDTIYGKIKDKNYYSASRVKLYIDNNPIFYNKNTIREIHVNSDNYVKSDNGIWASAFFKKNLSGSVNLYSFRRKMYLGGFDTDLNFGGLKPSIKFYCDDYPNLFDTLNLINKSNIVGFIQNYNFWKRIIRRVNHILRQICTRRVLLISKLVFCFQVSD